ncbi:hypothetical protein G7054_g1059 [Neopestalotiopsis clavispora]|nr:hypothetical protein G7054_g1059 [Neopestalotiopsis clavispora]
MTYPYGYGDQGAEDLSGQFGDMNLGEEYGYEEPYDEAIEAEILLARLTEEEEYGLFFPIIGQIAEGVQGYTPELLSPPENTIQEILAAELYKVSDNWDRVVAYAQVLHCVRLTQGTWSDDLQDNPTDDEDQELAEQIIYPQGPPPSQPADTSFIQAVLEFMIYDAANFAESVPDTIIARMQNLYPYTKNLLTAAFDRLLDRTVTIRQDLIQDDPDGIYEAYIMGIAEVSSRFWKAGWYTSPYAFVAVLRISLEMEVVSERGYFDAAKTVLENHSTDLRACVVDPRAYV